MTSEKSTNRVKTLIDLYIYVQYMPHNCVGSGCFLFSLFSSPCAGNIVVYTTAEIVLGECTDVVFGQTFDPQSGFDELVVEDRVD
jgi:hypothetical protein